METLETPQLAVRFSNQNGAKALSTNKTTLLGFLLLIVSTGLYGLGEYYEASRRADNFTIFLIHYLIAIAYVIILITNRSYGIRKSWRKENIHKTIVLLNLFLVSAYALNRELPVFEDSVTWFCCYLLISSITVLSYQYFFLLPKVVNNAQDLLLGSAAVLYLYMTIYVANFYILGSIGVILFGIGAHIFVPLLLLVSTIRVFKITRDKKRLRIGWAIVGAVITISIVLAFIVEWNARIKEIDRMANQSVINTDTDLPVWVKVAQTVKNDWITQRILKSRLVYTTSNSHFQGEFFPRNNWDEKKKHDPLVFLATGSSNSSLAAEDRKNILKAITDSRHKAQERLWSGDNLSTSYIVTDVDLYPELRLAYSEHYLNIRNTNVQNNNWWGNSEEAIYTFHLSEGSVVTSLSLWVNGKEEKGILTSKQKATAAYTTIVGRERRDPSVVHWQEGNTVSVRVFPCTPLEERKFKIGITSPLSVIGDKVVYKNVTFTAPHANSSPQLSRVRILGGSADDVQIPDSFIKNVKGDYLREGDYDPDLTISMDINPIKTNQFSFDGYTYSLSDPNRSMTSHEFKDIYLDINSSWTSGEITSITPLLRDFNVFVYGGDKFLQITPENWTSVTNELKVTNFSIFPFHQIKNTDTSLIITKGKEISPFLRDFKASRFAEGISEYFASGNKVYVFNLEGGTSTYIKSLKELRAFNFTQGKTSTLLNLLTNKEFPLPIESDEQITLYESDMVIQKKEITNNTPIDNAPDHLARLYAYNNIMREVGTNFFKDDFVNERLADQAASAYVVSPVSSIVVLETKEDYERFGIEDKENSLHNASKNSSGAVPEPHEWALIIVFLLFIAFYILRYSRLKSQATIK